jgi:hypothetical protein
MRFYDTDRELSDKNNNQMAPGLTDPFEETALQTIHEDHELIIEDGFRVNNVETIHHVAGANAEQRNGSREVKL